MMRWCGRTDSIAEGGRPDTDVGQHRLGRDGDGDGEHVGQPYRRVDLHLTEQWAPPALSCSGFIAGIVCFESR